MSWTCRSHLGKIATRSWDTLCLSRLKKKRRCFHKVPPANTLTLHSHQRSHHRSHQQSHSLSHSISPTLSPTSQPSHSLLPTLSPASFCAAADLEDPQTNNAPAGETDVEMNEMVEVSLASPKHAGPRERVTQKNEETQLRGDDAL